MKRKDIITLGILLLITIITALFATVWYQLKYVSIIILVLSILKFILVAFQFMELKKAHVFWKIALAIYLLLFMIIILLLQ